MSLLKRLPGFVALAVAAGLTAAPPATAGPSAAAERPATVAPRASVSAPRPAPTGPGDVRPGSLQDPDLRFVGRWDTSDPTTYIGNWGSPYVATGFTGTSIKATIRDRAT